MIRSGLQHLLQALEAGGNGEADFHEINVGPLRVGPSKARTVDQTLNPKVLLTATGRATFAFGRIAIDDASGRPTAEIRRVADVIDPGAQLVLDPRWGRMN